jgi:DNA repair exonuclease SbcCD nuclease subunit
MLRFVHTGDWQIGMKAAHVGPVGETVRAERLASVRRLVDVARKNEAAFLVVAGDAFEDNAIDRVLVQKIADSLAAFGRPVYLIPGNHDPLVPGSLWYHPAWKSHANLHVLTEAVPFSVASTTIYPCPLFEKHSQKDPTRWIDARETRGICVGIAHGTVEGVSQDELDYPIPRDAAVRCGLDYLALGHWHSTATYGDVDQSVRMAYSGTHETTKFGERDSGNVLLVEIESRGTPPKITPIRTGRLNWRIIDREIDEKSSLSLLRQEIEEIAEVDSTLLDVRLRGVLSRDQQGDLARIEDIVRARFLFGRIDSKKLLPRPEDDGWLADLPVGVVREVADRLKLLSDPTASVDRPDYATPEVAARALMELYRASAEVHG